MYSFIKHILLVMLSFIFYSCEFSSDPQTPLVGNFEYPLAIGNSWEYERTFEHYNFRPDSLKNIFSSTSFVHQTSVEVIKDTILQDSINCFVVRGKLFDQGAEYLSRGYYSNKSDGLYKYAYRSGGTPVILPKKNGTLRYTIAGISFRSLKEASDYFSKFLPAFVPINDILIYYNNPRKILAYPPETGEKWILHQGQPFTIHKNIVGTEAVSTDVGDFNCYKIQWTYESSFADDILFYDYICEKGLIKRSILFKDVAISTTDSPGGNGYVDTKEESILTDINF